MEISVVIITFNEERDIARCLASVKGLADEIVVVDSGSTDATVRIATAHGARVVQRAWTNYSDQKNFANGLAGGQYILSLDADEALSAQLRDSMLEARRIGLEGTYSMARLTNYCGSWIKHGGWYPDIKVRLFPPGHAKWIGEHVHETLQLHPTVKTRLLTGDLLHFSYHSISDHVRQADLFTTIAAQALHARGKRAGLLKMLGSPCAKFISGYLLRGGFRDGFHGFVIARISAAATFWKYAKLRQLWRERP